MAPDKRARADASERRLRGRARLDRFAKFVSLAGAIVLAFLAGMIAAGVELWPYPLLKRAEQGWVAFKKRYVDEDWAYFPAVDESTGVTVLDRVHASPGFTLLSEARPGEGFSAKLVDMDGTVVHRWRVSFRDVWEWAPPHIRRLGRPDRVRWHGLHLYPDGALLLNFETEHFPYGGGLVKLDQDSRVVWKVARNTHHAVNALPDGTILATALNWRPRGLPEFPFLQPHFYEDVVLRISPEGRVFDEVSIPEALYGAKGLHQVEGDGHDPTRINDVEMVTPELAAAFPMLGVGDLVVSMRTPIAIIAIIAIDAETRRAKLTLVGSWIKQNDVDLLPDGLISFYDNQGGPIVCGGTRIIKLDPTTQKIVWQYDGCAGNRFRSYAWGDHQWLPNGNLLVTEPFGGRAFEVWSDDPSCIVWEYVNRVGERDGKPLRGIVGEARRFAYKALPFARRPADMAAALGEPCRTQAVGVPPSAAQG